LNESAILKTIELSIPRMKNCFRCGSEFRARSGGRVCIACRKPSGKARRESRDLSLRERQVVDLVRQAKPNREIAFALHLSEGTIKEYLNCVFRTELALWALRSESNNIRSIT
jgi:DNA-binding NarL/FixJ family response regulator